MNWLIARLKEPSTKRGIIWLIAGTAVLFGYELSPEKIEQWIGIAMMIAGLMGWLPDEPKKLVEQSRSNDGSSRPTQPGNAINTVITADHHSQRLQQPVQSESRVEAPTNESGNTGWNG